MNARTQHLVLAGGGHTHALLLQQWAMRPLPGIAITLVSDVMMAPYSGMLPGLLAGYYTTEETHIDLLRLCRAANAAFVQARMTGIAADAREVQLEGRPPLRYDWLSINTGITPDTRVPGSARHSIPLKPVSRLRERWQAVIDGAPPASIAMVGGGAAGVETLLAMHEALHTRWPATRFFLLSARPLLAGHNRHVRQAAHQQLHLRGIAVHEDFRAARVEAGSVTDTQGRRIEADTIFWATQGLAADWLQHSSLMLDENGFIAVDEHLRSISHPDVFAAGDVAVQVHDPRPRAGVFAVRQAPTLAYNLRASIQGHTLVRYRPQRHFLSLISTGGRHAIASRGRFWAHGAWVWRWKDRIDRRFMAMFHELPDTMPAPHGGMTSMPMRCGGCGAKVGKSILDEVLAGLQPACGIDTVIALQQPDDAAVIAPPPGQQLVQSVDGFRSFIDDAFVFGRIATQHATSDLYAMGAVPHSALAFVTLPYGPTTGMANTLRQLLAGVIGQLEAEGMSLLGGHTAEGAELSLALTVNGFIAPGAALTKSRLQPGDRLVLGKPLGTGTIMAAHGRGAAHGAWVSAALESMQQSNGPAARVLRERGVVACTDVTGFGLLGHLLEMCTASGCGAALALPALPVLPGARECLARGIESTLAPENHRFAAHITNATAFRHHPLWPLLFDPQTSGGLLAGLPRGASAEGFTVIGEVTAAAGIVIRD